MPDLWTETTVAVASSCAEAVASFLLDLGSPGLITEDNPGGVTLTAFLAADASEQLAALRVFCDDLIAGAPGTPPVRIATRPLPQADWAHNWMEHFPPLPIGDRLYVVPPWITDTPLDRTVIVIDPGLAFGTGHHATTQGCLVLLEDRLRGCRIERALDLGTGSGILAIALAKLGVADVEAIDTDAEARRAAHENCLRNGVDERVHIGAEFPSEAQHFDLIVANLLGSLLIQLAPRLAAALGAGAHLIASGILATEAGAVTDGFAAHNLVEQRRIAAGEWVTLDLVQRP